MNVTTHFTTLTSGTGGTFAEQLQALKVKLRQWLDCRGLSPANLIMVRVYLTDAANQLADLKAHSLFTHYLSVAGFSYVEQPLLDGSKVALQLWAVSGARIVKTQLPDAMVTDIENVKIIYHSVRFSATEVKGMNGEEQTREAFVRHAALLGRYGLNLKDNCHRTWLYVRDIDRHYAAVVRGRNQLFEEEGLTADTHFIASTGIGGYGDNAEAVLGVDFLSVSTTPDANIHYLKAPDYLNPTAEYGVAFERGTALTLLGHRYRFISGTASIDRRGVCLYRNDVKAQTDRLFLNIDKLLETDGAALADMSYMIVYLRDVADHDWVKCYLDERFPHVPYLITEARVCRPEWLIEVEVVVCVPEH